MNPRVIFWAFVWSTPMWACIFLAVYAIGRAL